MDDVADIGCEILSCPGRRATDGSDAIFLRRQLISGTRRKDNGNSENACNPADAVNPTIQPHNLVTPASRFLGIVRGKPLTNPYAPELSGAWLAREPRLSHGRNA